MNQLRSKVIYRIQVLQRSALLALAVDGGDTVDGSWMARDERTAVVVWLLG